MTAKELAPELFGAPSYTEEAIKTTVDSFAEQHREVFETLRHEIGAGTVNYIESARKSLPADAAVIFDGIVLLPDGQWDTAALVDRIRTQGFGTGVKGLDAMIRVELERVTLVIPRRAAADLKSRLGLKVR